jgi:hypothetical protein
MMKKTNKIFYLGEGKTERRVKEALNLEGNFSEFNVWEKDIKEKLRTFTPQSEVVLMVDADLHNNPNCATRFQANLLLLRERKYRVTVLLQVDNLEDEVIRGFGDASRTCRAFGIKNKTELKQVLASINNLQEKLNNPAFNAKNLWTQPHAKCDNICKEQRVNIDKLRKIPRKTS